MSAPYHPVYLPQPTPKRPEPPKKPTDTEQHLLSGYQNIRLDVETVEEILGSENDLSDFERKQLDKAVVLMRVGSKMLKTILRKRGFVGRLKFQIADQEIAT